jgi:hypothetical protein
MVKAFGIAILLALAGCSGVAPRQYPASACSVSEASYACQIQRYHDVAAE